jgi:hypothetical protein
LQVVVVMVEGHLGEGYIGEYRKETVDGGWPVLKNENNKYLYRHQPLNAWVLWKEYAPHSSICAACIGSADGPLPE